MLALDRDRAEGDRRGVSDGGGDGTADDKGDEAREDGIGA